MRMLKHLSVVLLACASVIGFASEENSSIPESEVASPDTGMHQSVDPSIDDLAADKLLLQQKIAEFQKELARIEAEIKKQQLAQANRNQKVIKPEFTRRIGESPYGFNHSNPTWTLDGQFLGYERHDERSKEILITKPSGELVQTVKYQSAEEDDLGLGLLLPEFADNVSYNSGLSWSPDSKKFVFMSNGSESNYDLYLGTLGKDDSERVTLNSEKDGHAHWSPIGNQIAFISGRDGGANIYVIDTLTKATKQVSKQFGPYLYPQWSPGGDKVAVINGSNENHNIIDFENVLGTPTSRKLITWQYDDLRPIWSPDGKKIAFYTNYNEQNDPKVWSIAVVDAESETLDSVAAIKSHIVATNIIPDVDKGPAWMPDSENIVYVKNNRKQYNPIEIVNTRSHEVAKIDTDTRINHDVSCSKEGLIAFRSQVDQWDHIFVAKLPQLSMAELAPQEEVK